VRAPILKEELRLGPERIGSSRGVGIVSEPHGVRILQRTPARGGWKAVYAVLEEDGSTRLEEERISVFALCEDEGGNRFVSGLHEDGGLCVMREDFVGHYSVKVPRYKIQEAVGRFARAREQKEEEA
jgi:hypothetical protein